MPKKAVKISFIILIITTVTVVILATEDDFLIDFLGKCPKDKSQPFENLMNVRTLKRFSFENAKDTKISLIISTSTPDLTLGLSNIPCIPEKKGMIFEFGRPDYYGFWMKDMLINLDIAWLDDSYSVVYLLSDVSPETYPNILKPEPSLAEDEPIKPAMYVIEMKGGEMKRLGIKVGTKLVPISQN